MGPAMAYCPRCDKENPDTSAKCQFCGASMSSGTLVMHHGMMPKPKVTIRVVRADGGPETSLALKKDEALIGSAGDIPLMDDPFVARVQAKFFFSGMSLVVEDVAGGNGVFAKLKAEREVMPGMEVRCGRQRLLFESVIPLPPGQPTSWGSPDPGYRARVIQLLEGGRRGDAFPLREGENPLGRENGEITFPGDGFVSGRHAMITMRAERIFIKDVGSSNGTFFRLGGPTPLENGDHLLIGRQLLKLDIAPPTFGPGPT